MREPSSNKGRRGISLLLTVVSLTMVIPTIGIAIDGGMLYMVKARLTAAADAASLASARALDTGRVWPERVSTVRDAAQRFFRANFPDSYLGTRQPHLQVDLAETATHAHIVTATASVEAPCYFMRILGFQTVPVNARATTAVSEQGKANPR